MSALVILAVPACPSANTKLACLLCEVKPTTLSQVFGQPHTTKLVHAESGEWQESTIIMPLAKSDPQAYGSALTYARRYGLSAMVGLLAEDDDGNMACQGGSTGERNLSLPELQSPRIASLKPRENQFDNNSSQNAIIQNLPHIDGISYQQQKAKDGAVYITATGNTRNKNSILKEAGFKWNSSRKLWWKAA